MNERVYDYDMEKCKRKETSKIIQILGEGRLPGSSVASVCRKHGITQVTCYRYYRIMLKKHLTKEGKRKLV